MSVLITSSPLALDAALPVQEGPALTHGGLSYRVDAGVLTLAISHGGKALSVELDFATNTRIGEHVADMLAGASNAEPGWGTMQ